MGFRVKVGSRESRRVVEGQGVGLRVKCGVGTWVTNMPLPWLAATGFTTHVAAGCEAVGVWILRFGI